MFPSLQNDGRVNGYTGEAMNQSGGQVKIIRASSAFNCGGRCPLRLHVKDGIIIRVEGDDADETDKQLRACLRCRAYRKHVHHPDRLKYPQKRVGPKGEGKFERITWEEAYDSIAERLIHVKKTYGNSSIFLADGGGYLAALHSGRLALARLFNLLGGYTARYGNVSSEGPIWACLTQYGTVLVGHSPEDFLNSKLIIMWGWDPARMITGTNTMYHLIKAREAGAKVVCIDPRLNESAVVLADEWIPIYPGTDTAMMVAMAYVIIKEGLCDQLFLDRYTIGYDKFKDYVTGVEDGVEKTPAWAEPITGVSAAAMERLAKEYALTKPSALRDCQGPPRSAMGEQYNRCAMTLSAMTGNVGRPGGSAGGGLNRVTVGNMAFAPNIPPGKNPVEAGAPSTRGQIDLRLRLVKRVHSNKMFDAILKGTKGGYPADIKFAWFVANNYLNQLGNTNKAAEALKKLDFMVSSELFMTPTARYADILLPATSSAEKNELMRPWTSGPYFIFSNKAIEPLGECKSDLDIAAELAEKLGFKEFKPYTEEQYLKRFVEKTPDMAEEISDYEKFKREGIHRISLPEPVVAFKKQIEDPENNPFPTPSGKIEIFSRRVADIQDPLCPPIPKYIPTWEDRNDPRVKKYPFQLLSPHPKIREHSNLHKVDWLREMEPHRVWINPQDADPRGIGNNDEILVYNDRGIVAIRARVTERIMPGVVSIDEGAWYDPDEQGIDRGGCVNVLTPDEISPGGASALKTALVGVRKA